MAGTSFWDGLGSFLGFGSGASALRDDLPPRKVLSPQEQAFEDTKRAINDAMRQANRETTRIKRSEAIQIRKVREEAEAGRMDQGRAAARLLVATRRSIMRIELGCTRLQQLSQKMQVLRTNAAIVMSTERAVAIMQLLNATMNSDKLAALVQNLQQQDMLLNAKSEELDEALDDMFDADDTGELDDALDEKLIFEQICAECGLAQAGSLPAVPLGENVAPVANTAVGTAVPVAAGAAGAPEGSPPRDAPGEFDARLSALNDKKKK